MRRHAAAGGAAARQARLPPGIGHPHQTAQRGAESRSLRTFDLFLDRAAEPRTDDCRPGSSSRCRKSRRPPRSRRWPPRATRSNEGAGMPRGVAPFEFMVETTQSIFAADGRVALPRLVAEGRGRVRSPLRHVRLHGRPVNHRRASAHDSSGLRFRQARDAGRAGGHAGVRLSDGATNIMPVGPHRAPAGGVLTESTAARMRGRAPRVASARRAHSALARRRVLSGLGSPSGAAPQPLRGGLRVFP